MELLRHHKHLVPMPLDTTSPLKQPDTARLMVRLPLAMVLLPLAMVAHLLHHMVPRACRRTGAKRKASCVQMCLPTEGVNAAKRMRLQLLVCNREMPNGRCTMLAECERISWRAHVLANANANTFSFQASQRSTSRSCSTPPVSLRWEQLQLPPCWRCTSVAVAVKASALRCT